MIMNNGLRCPGPTIRAFGRRFRLAAIGHSILPRTIDAVRRRADDGGATAPPHGKPRPHGTGREALLSAAVRVVAERGLRHLTYRSVAKEAGVNHGLVTHYFGSIDELITQALQASLANSVPSVTSQPGSGRVDLLGDGLADLVADAPDVQAFQFEIALESRRRADLAPQVRELYNGYRAAIRTELVAAGREDEDLVAVIFAMFDGLVFQQVCGLNELPTERVVAALRDLLLRAAPAEETSAEGR